MATADSPQTLLGVAQIARSMGDQALARRVLNEARALFPDSADVHFAFGQDCLQQDDIDRAREAFERVTELDPTNVKAWINYGATCGEAELAGEAARALERALELDPTSRDATSNLGVLRREAGQLDEAERLFRRSIEMDPTFVFGYYNLAHCLFLAGRFEESVAEYRAGLKRDSAKTPNQNARLAWALLANGEEDQAQRELKRALERFPEEERDAFVEEAREVLAAIEAAQPDRGPKVRVLAAQIVDWDRTRRAR
ncbi:MAG: tetratricopeptide repeat protein [Vicinamibacteria bacterium]